MLLNLRYFPSLVGRAKDKIDERKLSRWKLLDDSRERLAKAQVAALQVAKKPGGPERRMVRLDDKRQGEPIRVVKVGVAGK